MAKPNITSIIHPHCLQKHADWKKFRLTMGSSQKFIDNYLQKFSTREDNNDFNLRKRITPNPAFAKAAVLEIRNNIYKCMGDIVRLNGSEGYQSAVIGENGGVDRQNSSMDYFIGMEILQELLSMGKVGVYIDRPQAEIYTKADAKKSVPYVYLYTAEQIRSWSYTDDGVLESVLLEDERPVCDDEYNLTTTGERTFRHLQLTEEGVRLTIYDTKGDQQESMILNLTAIPFVVAELSDSLLEMSADYQIAMLNMESSDINYSLQANFPFYTEQFIPNARHFAADDGEGDPEGQSSQGEHQVGSTKGRLYGKNLERPGFIHPSSEPLSISMEKQEKMKETIRHLMQLAIAALRPVRASAESKQQDQSGLKDGLAYIGMELQRLETGISLAWADYDRDSAATIKYPEVYDLRTVTERLAEAENYKSMINLPSIKYQKEVAKTIIRTLMENTVSNDDLQSMYSQIDNAEGIAIDPEVLRLDAEAGLVDLTTASGIRLYPEGAVATAKTEHIERLSAIAIAQSVAPIDSQAGGSEAGGIRGVDDDAADDDKTDNSTVSKKKPTRGKQVGGKE